MNAAVTEILRTVRPDGTLELDQKVDLAPGRVRVRVETVPAAAPTAETLVAFIARARRHLESAGHRFLDD